MCGEQTGTALGSSHVTAGGPHSPVLHTTWGRVCPHGVVVVHRKHSALAKARTHAPFALRCARVGRDIARRASYRHGTLTRYAASTSTLLITTGGFRRGTSREPAALDGVYEEARVAFAREQLAALVADI